jgi:hypothetical protein
MGLFRRRTRAQNDRGILAKQSGFLGGMNIDNPPSEIDETEVALLDNMIPFRSYTKSRSGVKTYGNLPGTGDLHSIFEHEGNLTFVCHVGTELYYSEDSMDTWVLITGEAPADADSDMKALSDDVLFFQEDRLYRIELKNSSGVIARPLNQDNPTEYPVFDDVVDASDANHTYRYTYTFARIVDGELVAESGNLTPEEAIDPDYVEIHTVDPISANNYPTISSLTVPVGSYWTDIRLYRTLDIHPDNGGINSSEIYYLIETLPLDQVTGLDIGVDFDFIIDDTLPPNDPGQPSPILEVGVEEGVATSDETLIAGGEFLLTRFFQPLPNGIVNEVTPGFVFVGNRDAKKLPYSSVGDVPRRVGYYQPAFQFFSLDDSLRFIVGNPDSVIVCCTKSTYRGTIFTERNVGNTNVGEVIAQLEPVTVIDADVGVLDYGSIAKMDTGRFIAHCSDSSIRVWEGRQWGIDLSRFKVQSEIKKIFNGSVGVYNSDGYYLLWYSSDKSSPVRDKCLRYGLAEDVGKGWCFYSGSRFPFPVANVGAISSIDPTEKKQLILCYDNAARTMVQVETFDGPTGSNYTRSDVDLEGEVNEAIIPWKVQYRELTGSQESYFCVHQQTNIYVRPVSPDKLLSNQFGIDVKIGADGVNDIDSAISVDATGDAFFFKESAKITGHRLQISAESTENREGCIVRGYDTKYRVQDRRDLTLTSTENEWQSEVGDIADLWLCKPYFEINRADAKLLEIVSGSYVNIDSPDSRTNSLSVTQDFEARTQATFNKANFALSGWFRTVQTLNGNTLEVDGTEIFSAVDTNTLQVFGTNFAQPGTIDLDEWQHIFIKVNGNTGTLYADGNVVESKSITPVAVDNIMTINGGIKDIFDLRLFDNAPSIESIRYYIDDVLSNEGRIALPGG